MTLDVRGRERGGDVVSFCSRGRGGGKEAHLEEIQGRPKGDRRAHARPDRLRLRQVDDLLRVLGARSYLLRQVHSGQVAHVVHIVEPGLHQRPPQARRARHEVSVQAGRQHHSRTPSSSRSSIAVPRSIDSFSGSPFQQFGAVLPRFDRFFHPEKSLFFCAEKSRKSRGLQN